MITKSRNLLIGFLLMIAMLLGVFAMTPLTAFAISDADKPAETIYVGGVALNAGQYVKNGETTATTGEPAEDADGYAYYKADGTLLLVSYSYEGNGYEYDSGMYAVIYSSGALSVELRGENVLKQTSEGKRGIFAVGNLDIDGVGSLSVSADWSIYSNGIITFKETLGKVDLTVTGTGRAIVSLYDSGSATDHDESILVKGGDISATTYYGLDDLVITGGALTISSSYYALNMHPVINYDGEYTAVVSYNEDGSDSAAYDPAKLITESPNNYFRIAPAPKTAIDSVSVSGIDLPEFGEAFNAEVDLDALTYGGEYKVADHWLEKYTGDEWVEYTGSDDLIEYDVRYRYVLSLMPNGGYSFSSEITDGGVKINDKAATVYKITEYPFYNAVEIACEFSYEATFITSISVSGADLPEVGETADDMEFTPTSLTYGGAYQMTGISIEKYTGTNWVFYSGSDDVIEAGVRYRLIITLMPTGTDAFAELLTSDDVTFNGKDAEFLGFVNAGTAKYAQIALEFSYEASSTTPITSISVSGADLPEVGETKDVMEFTPDSLTYGGEYKMVGRGLQKYTGTEWVDVSDTESLEYGVKYRVSLVLAPNEGYAFADSITSDDVTFNGKDAEFLGFANAGTAKYARIALEFSYEASATGYGIFIADKDESGATVGVEINEENRTDVLGDGTVSYDPTTSTLTLNGYKYEGEGFLSGSDYYYGICVTEFFDDLTLVLAGENVITMTDSGTGMMHEPYYTGIELWNGNLTIKGDGSLAISSPGDGICVYGGEDGRGVLEIKGGSITIEGDDEGIYTDNSFKMTGGSLTVGATYGIYTYVFEMNGGSITVNAVADYAPGAICAYESFLMNGGTITASATGENAYTIYLEGDFTMNGGSLKLSADFEGIILREDSSIVVSGGTLEISTKEAGHAFIRNTESDGAVSIVPTVTGDYSMTASVNEDGSSAVIYDEDAHETYKYVKIAFVTKYGITIADKDESGATVGVEITSENYTDVLGDGTVSYDPTTNTLTLNNYVYNGEGWGGDDVPCAIMADFPAEGLTIVLAGTNSITVSGVSGSEFAGMVFFGEGDLTIKGNGSLVINAGTHGIVLVECSGRIKIDGGNIDITTTEAMSVGIMALDFVITSGSLKITTQMIGVGTPNEDGIHVNGGEVEIDTTMGGYAYIYLDFEHMSFNPIKPELSGYVGAYKMTAGMNQDGSDASDFNEVYLNSYKYVKVEPTHVHDYGTAWESDENNHWNECECGDKANVAPHADENSDGKCDTCEYTMTVIHTHNYGTTWQSDENNHWNECECGDKANVAPHADENNDGKCDTCDYAMGNADNPGGDKESEKTGLSGGAIAGIAVGSVAVVGLGGFSLFWFVIKKKKFADLIALFKKK
ncbi:MAG: carbohydrate-binding domain-containing protein [Christensenellales bacterium]